MSYFYNPYVCMARNRLRRKCMTGAAIKLLLLMTATCSTSALAVDQSLSVSASAEAVTVVMKVPQALKPEKLEVMYRSEICKRFSYTASGIPIEMNGFNSMDIVFVPYQGDGSYIAKAPISGGGECSWKISNIAFGATYGDTSEFDENVLYSGGAGISVSFDEQNPMRGESGGINVEGDVYVEQDYYPWVGEHFLGGYIKVLWLAGDRNLYKRYIAKQARNIYFEPVLHSDFVVSSKSPSVKAKGNRTIFTYPDGISKPEASGRPSFRKLQEIRLESEGG